MGYMLKARADPRSRHEQVLSRCILQLLRVPAARDAVLTWVSAFAFRNRKTSTIMCVLLSGALPSPAVLFSMGRRCMLQVRMGKGVQCVLTPYSCWASWRSCCSSAYSTFRIVWWVWMWMYAW
jgi:hypothetical protein